MWVLLLGIGGGGPAPHAAAGPFVPAEGPGVGHRATWALIVGIDRYKGGDTGLEQLRFAVHDARAMRDLLCDEFGFLPAHTLFLTEEEATLGALKTALGEWLPKQKPQAEDAVLVFFAGHGLIDGQGKGYLAAVDSRADDLGGKCLPVKWVQDTLQKLPCRQKLVILDSCYSGSLFLREPDACGKADAFFGISAGRQTPVADGDGAKSHSVFTAALLQVLRERADSRRPEGSFSLRELAPQVYHRVRSHPKSRQLPEWGRLAPGEGDFFFHPTLRRLTPRDLADRERYGRAVVVAKQLYDEGNVEAARALLESQEPRDAAPDRRGFEWHYLWNLCRGDLFTLRGHAALVTALAFSPDGKTLASADKSQDGSIRLWDAASGVEKLRWAGHFEGVACLAFAPDGKTLVSGGNADAAIKVWDTATGQVLKSYRLLAEADWAGTVTSLGYTPDGKTLAVTIWPYLTRGQSSSLPGRAMLLDAATGREKVPLGKRPGLHYDFFRCCLSPDGKLLATGSITSGLPLSSTGAGIGLWEVATGKELATLRPKYTPDNWGGVRSLAFSPDGRTIYSCAERGWRYWDVAGQGERGATIDIEEGRTQEIEERIQVFALSPDGLTLATPGLRKGTTQLRFANGIPLETLVGHTDDVLQVAFSPDGRRLATASADKTIKIWDRTARPAEIRLSSSNDRMLLRLAADPERRRYGDARVNPILDAADQLFKVMWSPNGKYLASILRDPESRAFDGAGQAIQVWDRTASAKAWVLPEPEGPIEDVSFSPDGQTRVVAVNRYDPTAHVWQAILKLYPPPAKGDVLRGHSSEVCSVAFSPNGRRLASTSGNIRPPWVPQRQRPGETKVWEVATGRELFTLPAEATVVGAAAFSLDGKWIATTDDATDPSDSDVGVWEMATGRNLFSLRGHPHFVSRILYSADGKRLVTTSSSFWDPETDRMVSGEVRVWDAGGGKETLALRLSENPGHPVLSTDGRYLAFSTGHESEQTGWICDLDTGEVVQLPRSRGLSFRPVEFSRDSKYLLSSGYTPQRGWFWSETDQWEEVVRVWRVSDGAELFTRRGDFKTVATRQAAFTPDGKHVVACFSGQAGIRLWSLDQSGKDRTLVERTETVVDLACSTNGRLVAVLEIGKGENSPAPAVVNVYDLATGRLVNSFGARNPPSAEGARALVGFTPDSGEVVEVDQGAGTVTFGDVATGKARVVHLEGHAGRLVAVVLSADGRRIASASWGAGTRYLATVPGEVKVWDAATGRELLKLNQTDFKRGIEHLALSPDGRCLAAAAGDPGGARGAARTGVIKLWNSATGRPVRTLRGHTDRVLRVAFGPDPRCLASASRDGTVRVWDILTGQELLVLRSHVGAVCDLAYSPDGERLVSSGYDGKVRVWDALTGQGLLDLYPHTGLTPFALEPLVRTVDGQQWVESKRHTRVAAMAAFSPDGKHLAASSQNRTLTIWATQATEAGATNRALSWHRSNAEECIASGTWFGAAFHLNPLVEADPRNGLFLAHRGHARATLGQWEPAIEDYKASIRCQLDVFSVWHRLALAQLHLNDIAGYRQTCRELLERHGKTEGLTANRVAWLCSLAPEAVPERELPVQLSMRAEATGFDLPHALSSAFPESYYCVPGAALYRAGRFDAAVESLTKTLARLEKEVPQAGESVPSLRGRTVYEWLYLAMACQRLGQGDEARRWLDKAVQWFEHARKPSAERNFTLLSLMPWDQHFELDFLRREAEALVGRSKP